MNRQKLFLQLIKAIFLSFILLGLQPEVHAQFGKLKRKVGKKAEQEVEEKAEKEVNKSVDQALNKLFKKVEESIEENKKKNESKKDSSLTLSGEKGDVSISAAEPDPNVEPSSFIGSFTMRVEEYKNDKLQRDYPQTTVFHVDKYKVGMENSGEENVTILFDRQYRRITTKSVDDDGTKRAITIGMPSISVQVNDEELSEGDYTVRNTGRTKTIAGYRCEQYKMESDEVVTYAWVSNEVGLNYQQFFNWIQIKDQQQGGYVSYSEFYPVEGSILESTTTEKKGNTKSIMVVEKIDKGRVDPSVFSLEGYEHQDMSKFMESPEGQKFKSFLNDIQKDLEEKNKENEEKDN